MISFQVNDMTCGHCVGRITQALKAEDATAAVRIDLAAHRVDIEPGRAGAAELSAAIQAAGYTPTPMAGISGRDEGQAPARRAGCGRGCGC